MSLKKEIDKIRPDVRTESYSMSVGEWISLYENDEIDIHPEFQRFYRWSDSQKTRLIESLLLGIPIPPIFVSQRDDGVWDVVDGLQRLSTIFQFVGILRDEKGTLVDPLILEKTKHLPSLNGKRWKGKNAFDAPLRLYIKRARLDVNLILKESDEFAKFELFQRLNTGGSPLSDQEIRNCILVQQNRENFEWLRKLSKYISFRESVLLSENAIDQQYDLELVLRFIVFRKIDEREIKSIGDLGQFLTDKMLEIASNSEFAYDEEKKAFEKTFSTIFKHMKEDAFRKYDKNKRRYTGGFLITPYEVFGIGLGYHIDDIKEDELDLSRTIKNFWSKGHPSLKSGSGVRASTRIPTTIPLGREIFEK